MADGGDERMRLAARYSFKNGYEEITARYPDLLAEVVEAAGAIDAASARTKVSEEKSMPGQVLYSPVALNAAFKSQLYPRGWKNFKVPCDYPTRLREDDHLPQPRPH